MKNTLLIISLAVGLPLAAQDIIPKDSERDPVLSALLDNSVDEEESAKNDEPPVHVTGTPPDNVVTIDDTTDKIKADPGGIKVDVEGGSSAPTFDAKEIKLVAPFPARPLAREPRGWRLVHPDTVPVIAQPVELPNGTRLRLAIRPHVLVPNADGNMVFSLSEPGYDPAKGYAQTDTVGSVLAESIYEMDDNSSRLSAATQRLTELLDSLPSAPPVEPLVTEESEAPEAIETESDNP